MLEYHPYQLKSGPVSITTELESDCTKNEVLSLSSFLLVDKQTSHLHAITGIPCEVPVPKNIPFILPTNLRIENDVIRQL